MNNPVTKSSNPLVHLHRQLEDRTAQFAAALPAHIPVERFKRVLLTAIQMNPKLATADRPTLFTSAMKAAHDGLLPDGREGALVIYKTKVVINGQDKWVDGVQWMPMIAGLRKKVRNSKEIATWDAKVVYEKDEFLYEDGLDLILKHKPYIDGDPGEIRAVYSVAKLKTGEISVDVMPKFQIDRIRGLSKSPDKGPWGAHYSEMAKKTVARRHSKVLPMNTDLDDLLRADDSLYDMDGSSDKTVGAAEARPQLSDFSDVDTNEPVDITIEPDSSKQEIDKKSDDVPHDAETGEVQDDEGNPVPEFGHPEARELGYQACMAGKSLMRIPSNLEPEFHEAWQDGWRSADEDKLADKAATKNAKAAK